MIETAATLARGLDVLGAAVAIGAARQGSRAPVLQRRLQRWGLWVALAASASWLWMRAALALDVGIPELRASDFATFATQTRTGAFGLARIILLGAASALASWPARRNGPGRRAWLLALLAAVAQIVMALSGHAATAEVSALQTAMHVVHVLAASLWLGGIVALTPLALDRATATSTLRHALARFSPLALVAMLAIVTSGIADAVARLDRWPALFGTPFGQQLLWKVALLAAALACACVLRWRWLPRMESNDVRGSAGPRAWLLAEAGLALAITACASRLATLPPGRHDAVRWPFPFRVAWEVTWPNPDVRQVVWAAAAAGAGVVVLVVLHWRRAGARAGVRGVSALPAALSFLSVLAVLSALSAWAVDAVSVQAWPDTYRSSSVAYDCVSVANGRALYERHCASCHGLEADGRGPLAARAPKPPADLTAGHARDHTPGDLFEWISNGTPSGAMPGLAARLAEDDRWDLVNYLHALAGAYQARVIQSSIAPASPWLPAPAFEFDRADGERGALLEWRDKGSVLLVFASGPGAPDRFRQLERSARDLAAAGLKVLWVAPAGAPPVPDPMRRGEGIEVVQAAAAVHFAYGQFRHTLQQLRPGETAPPPLHLEFLVDRFGYLRARWVPEDAQPGWADVAQLAAQARLLAQEPRIRPPPDTHLH